MGWIIWDNQKPASFFTMSGLPPPPFNKTEAQEALQRGYIDYLCGRAIKGEITDNFDAALYDRDAPKPAKEVIEELRK